LQNRAFAEAISLHETMAYPIAVGEGVEAQPI
jgi:hypothetical protein